jgi:hypothetical protein
MLKTEQERETAARRAPRRTVSSRAIVGRRGGSSSSLDVVQKVKPGAVRVSASPGAAFEHLRPSGCDTQGGSRAEVALRSSTGTCCRPPSLADDVRGSLCLIPVLDQSVVVCDQFVVCGFG